MTSIYNNFPRQISLEHMYGFDQYFDVLNFRAMQNSIYPPF